MAEKSSQLDEPRESHAAETNLTRAEDAQAVKSRRDDEMRDETNAGGEIAGEPEEIRAQIEETRGQMSETIDAIQEKLSFANISEQVKEQVSEHISSAFETAKDTVYDATIGKAGSFMKNAGNEISKSTLYKKAKETPFPFILVGLGIGFLAYKGFGRKKSVARYDARSGNTRYGKSASPARRQPSGKSLLKSAREKIGGAYEGISDAAVSAYEGVTGTASDAYQGASDFAGDAYEKVGGYGTQARDQYERYIQENPLAVGAVALAIGAAIGAAIPSTRYEGEMLGEARQNLMQKAQDSAGELIDSVKGAVGEAGQTIGKEVKNLTASQ